MFSKTQGEQPHVFERAGAFKALIRNEPTRYNPMTHLSHVLIYSLRHAAGHQLEPALAGSLA